MVVNFFLCRKAISIISYLFYLLSFYANFLGGLIWDLFCLHQFKLLHVLCSQVLHILLDHMIITAFKDHITSFFEKCTKPDMLHMMCTSILENDDWTLKIVSFLQTLPNSWPLILISAISVVFVQIAGAKFTFLQLA